MCDNCQSKIVILHFVCFIHSSMSALTPPQTPKWVLDPSSNTRCNTPIEKDKKRKDNTKAKYAMISYLEDDDVKRPSSSSQRKLIGVYLSKQERCLISQAKWYIYSSGHKPKSSMMIHIFKRC